mgnify:CR=1 FL=1
MNRLKVWRCLADLSRRNIPCVLLLTAGTEGSGPGSPGAVMVVGEDTHSGTVGGGPMEAALVARAAEKLSGGDAGTEAVRHQHSSEGRNISGMLCSGSQTTLLIPVGDEIAAAADRILEIYSGNGEGTLRVTERGVTVEEGSVSPHTFTEGEGGWVYTGPVGVADTAYIVGGGHVGRALAALLPGLAFGAVVIDPRSEPSMRADREFRWICAPYSEAAGLIPEGEHSWAVIMTPEHSWDSVVLQGLSGIRLKYIGLMASTSKRDAIYSDLLEKGISSAFLQTVHCPLGLPIGSRTPEEIAVSVAAELIGIRSRS